MYRQITPLIDLLDLEQWPVEFFPQDDLQGLFESIYVVDHHFSLAGGTIHFSIKALLQGEIRFTLPGLTGSALVIGVPTVEIPIPAEDPDAEVPSESEAAALDPDFPFDNSLPAGWTQVSLGFELDAGRWTLTFYDLSLELRVESSLLRPVEGSQEVTLRLRGDLTVDDACNITLDALVELDLPACEIGDTGLVLAASGVILDLSRQSSPPEILAAGFGESFIGIFFSTCSVEFPADLTQDNGAPVSLEGQNVAIGDGGISGSFNLAAPLSASFSGFQLDLQSGEVTFLQNSIIQSSLAASLQVPFFDQPLDILLSLSEDGGFFATLSQADADGLFTLAIPSLGTLTLSSLGFSTQDGETALLLSGSLQLEVLSPMLQWPTVDLQDLRITANGEIQLPDGWIDLQVPVSLDLFSFRLEITRLGFGSTEDDRRWVGFSGGVQLVEFLPTGASIEGLRITWDPAGHLDAEITLQGVGIELTLPGVLNLDGDVAFYNEETQSYFQGNAKLDLLPLGIQLDASIKIGRDHQEGYKFVYTYMGVTLPIGIPLWATGAALYGIAGLYGMNVNPSAQDSDWYGWYTGQPAPYDMTNAGKWIGLEDGKALGAGMTVGTLFDVGRVVTVKGLFALILPGPVILLQGRANFLATPPDPAEPSSQGVLDALAVLDLLAGDLQINIDAGWSKAQVIDISASAEAYFNFANPRDWHFYLGQDTPEEKRIRAYVLGLFHGDAYLMIDSQGIQTGAGISWGYDWKFGVVKVVLRSWIEAQAGISWQPPQLEGSLQVGGEFEISAAGFGIGLSAEAGLSGKAPSPYWVMGEVEITVKLPVPLKDLDESVLLEWHEEVEPGLEDPFRSIGLEHLKVDETWTNVVMPEQDALPVESGYQPGPIVPLDARPSIVFDRSMKDVTLGRAFVSVDAYPGGSEIGSYTFDYELQEVTLEKWPKAGGTGWTAVEDIYGAWMAVEDGSGEPAFTRLQVWAKTPFSFTRQTSRTYRDAFLEAHRPWPCVEPPTVTTYCVDWEDVNGSKVYGPAFEKGGLQFTLVLTDSAEVFTPDISACDTHNALLIGGSWKFLWIVFPEPVHVVELCLGGMFAAASSYANGVLLEQKTNPDAGTLGFQTPGMDAIGLWTLDDGWIARICYQTEAEVAEYTAAFEHSMSVFAGITRWDSQDEILEPETWYRLTVRQETVRTHNGNSQRTPYTHAAYFQTAGPPGLPQGSQVLPNTNPDENVLVPYPDGGKLTDLREYIRWSIPADGQQPVYRAYDLGAEFNENYVEQMYGADMALRLLDANAQPIYDAEGNEVVFPNQWAEQPSAELSETEYPYTNQVVDCLEYPIYHLPDQKIVFSNGVLLDEDFSGDLTQWSDPHPEDGGGWSIAGAHLEYNNASIPLLGALLVAGASEWGDYAVEVTLGDQGGDVGVACRYTTGEVETYYRLRLNAAGRALERVMDCVATTLWSDEVAYTVGSADVLALQCIGARLRGQLDGELLFDLIDETPLLTGQVGIFTNTMANFEHFLVRVWPGSALGSQTMYRADLEASYVLFSGGLEDGYIDSNYGWVELVKTNARLAAIGREDWDNYRVEVNATITGTQIGLLARFQQDPAAGTFTSYRLHLSQAALEVVLEQLTGAYTGSTYDLTASGRERLWACAGDSCGIDFSLATHALALTCDGDWLAVEVDGVELHREEYPNRLATGKAGLYSISADDPEFSDLVVRSAPRKAVYGWSFITSRFAGFVEHMDSFNGTVYREEVEGVNLPRLKNKAAAAQAEVTAASTALAAARTALAAAGPDEVTIRREATTAALTAMWNTSASQWDALYAELFGTVYRPLPPLVEISQVVSGARNLALLLESPEPLDWRRITWEISLLDPETGAYAPVEGVLAVWSDDGARALFVWQGAAPIASGDYSMQLAYSLDIGLEAPLLRRGGSSLPEIARLGFSL